VFKDYPKSRKRKFRVRLCGQLTKEYLPEVERTLNSEGSESQTVALDLANVTFVDRGGDVFCVRPRRKTLQSRIAVLCNSLDPAGTPLRRRSQR